MKTIIRRPAVLKITGLSFSSIYRKYMSGDFPKPVSLGENSIGWYEDEVAEWIENRQRVEYASTLPHECTGR